MVAINGKLIDIEGLDGSGKTTQTDLLCSRLENEGVSFRRIKLPAYESQSSALVKMYLNGDFGKAAGDVNAYAASAFYAVDRFASFVTGWKEAYENGELIIADRYAPANAIYQMTKLNSSEWDAYLDWLCDFEYKKIAVPQPDLVLFLDMPVDISQRLMTARYRGDESKKDVHESNVAFLNKCREAALYATERKNWTRVPCSSGDEPLSIDVLGEKIYSLVMEEINS